MKSGIWLCGHALEGEPPQSAAADGEPSLISGLWPAAHRRVRARGGSPSRAPGRLHCRKPRSVDDDFLADVRTGVRATAEALRRGTLTPVCRSQTCAACDYRGMCSARQATGKA